jgi:hypothetical protein
VPRARVSPGVIRHLFGLLLSAEAGEAHACDPTLLILSNASLFCQGKTFSKCFDIQHNHTSIGIRITNQGSGPWPRAFIQNEKDNETIDNQV